MHHLSEIPITLVSLSCETSKKFEAYELRGSIAKSFPSEPLFHQHQQDENLYRYPQIQYRREKNKGIIFGIQEGASRITELPWLEIKLEFNFQPVLITEVDIAFSKAVFGVENRLIRYRFLSPWIPFSSSNYSRYHEMSVSERRLERDRLLLSQILSALKGLGIHFPERLYAAFEKKREILVPYKDQQMNGFLGHFVSNALLPNHLALGRSVSHGYGWIIQE
jgi:hypothetical protein